MPTHKNLKKLIRARMSKTGESYSTARMHVLANAGKPVAVAPTANAGPPSGASADIDVAAQQMNHQSQELMDKANPTQRLQEMKVAEKAHSARSLHEMRSASDPARRLQEMKMLEKVHSAQSLMEMMDAADPGKPK
jgi:hypothetical protein